MKKIKDLKRNKQFNNSLVKLLSIIFNPKKYPLSEQKVITLIEKLFSDKKVKDLISKDLLFTEYGYYIDQSNILNSDVIVKALFGSEGCFSKQELIWAFSPLFNKQEDSYNYFNKLLKALKQSNSNRFCNNAIKAINYLEDKDLFKQNRRYENSVFSIDNYSNILEMYRNFDNWGIWYEVSPIILRVLGIICNLNKNCWYETIKKFKKPVIIHALNDDYKRSYINCKYTIPKELKNISDSFISLIILNYVDKINNKNLSVFSAKKYFKLILDNIDRLGYNKFYWYGLLSDFSYVPIYNTKKEELIPLFRKQVQNRLIKNILRVNNKPLALKYFTKGLENYYTNISYRYLDIYQKIEKVDKPLANYIRKIILNNYVKSINDDKFYAPLDQEDGVYYTNVIIDSIFGLVVNKQVSVTKLFEKILNKFYITEEDYIYNSSEMIDNKKRIMQFFTVMFYCIENLQKTEKKISKTNVNKYFDLFIKYINLHTWYTDNALKQVVDAIFKLNIVIDNDILSKEIEMLTNMPIPPFSLLAILVSKAPENEKAQRAKDFLEEYFQKYNAYWGQNGDMYKKRIYEEWFNISVLIQSKDIAYECLNNLPQNIKKDYEQVYSTVSWN